ncbi:MAG: hypothetical protein V1738_06090 [Patescibacteria group bacterium]
MILILDYRQATSALLLADEKSVRRFSDTIGNGFRQLDEMLNLIGPKADVQGVAVVLADRTDDSAENKLTWSTVRAAVSLANSLAFAWGVPAVRIAPSVVESELVERAKKFLSEANPSSRVSALYDGEPNITKPKAAPSSNHQS